MPNLDISDAALVMLNSDTVGEWTNQTGFFGESASTVTIVVAATQNGADDYAGVDDDADSVCEIGGGKEAACEDGHLLE